MSTIRGEVISISAETPPKPDGTDWSAEHISSNGASAGLPNDTVRRLVILGYITAVAMPIIGLVLGVVVATRKGTPSSRHGIWIVIVSIVALAVWIAVFASGVLTSSSNDLTY